MVLKSPLSQDLFFQDEDKLFSSSQDIIEVLVVSLWAVISILWHALLASSFIGFFNLHRCILLFLIRKSWHGLNANTVRLFASDNNCHSQSFMFIYDTCLSINYCPTSKSL